MEFKLNSTVGEGSLPLFGGGGAELSGSFAARHGAEGSGGGELCEELELELEQESTSMSTDHPTEEVTIRARRGD